MKLYHCKNSRSLRCIWALEELGLDAEVITLAFPPRVRQTEYLEVNPTGTIPYLIDGEVRMSESMAIVEYLTEKAGGDLIVQPGQAERANYLNFLHMGEASLVPPLTMIVRYKVLEPAERKLPQAVEDFTAVYHDRLKLVGQRLESHEYMADGRFTAADISVAYALFLGDWLRQGPAFTPAVAAYLERMKARPAFQRALERN
ncbi:MAG: glutathione S-transferase family protein [Caulobacteraceae bacterium]